MRYLALKLGQGYSEWEISFFTGLPIYLVKEYEEIIKEYGTENENKSREQTPVYNVGVEG